MSKTLIDLPKAPSVKPTILFSKIDDVYPVWVLPIGSLMLNQFIKAMPTVDEVILEARGLLANRYGWRGREADVAETLSMDKPLHDAEEVNREWDLYNIQTLEYNTKEYLRTHSSPAPIA